MFDTSTFAPMRGRLRIVHCVRAPIGGIFRNVLDLAAEQSKKGHLVGIVLDSTTGGVFEAERIAAAAPYLALGVIRLPMSRSIHPRDVLSAIRVYRIVADLQPDILHGHGAKGGTFARLTGTLLRRRGSSVARFYTPHGGSLHFDETSLAGRGLFAIERLLERTCDGLVHVSRYEAEIYRRKIGAPSCPAAIVVNGLRPDEFAPIADAEGAADLLFMGMVRKMKGPDVLIRAVAALRDRSGVAPTLGIVGDGPDLAEMQQLAAGLGLGRNVTFHDPRPTREGLAMGRVVVVPSRAESMPYVVLEAIAAGKPLVASRVGGIPEIVGTDYAGLVPAGDVAALADRLGHMMDDMAEARRLAAAARRGLRERFTVDAMTRSVEVLYRNALGRAEAQTQGAYARLEPAE